MPDLQKIRELVEMMVNNDLIELAVRDGDQEIKLRRPNATMEYAATPGGNSTTTLPTRVSAPMVGLEPEVADDGASNVKLIEIRSPMVGTFYAAPDPDSAPYVKVGDRVGPATVVCVLEAMKVFSEIKAEVSGAIDRVLVKNGDAVEYGQPLFLVRPD